ncbi:SHOC2 [Branchiostoma lanceolatum]|uniref:Leucine-rich repeat protein SHOC-2 n=1 Tax=Branchiostoma lanceolatum TaxID=7740 RepID=A0A8J9YRS1_BRALA|nr:SHOC2 [Branchiostoma lanceolatum]
MAASPRLRKIMKPVEWYIMGKRIPFLTLDLSEQQLSQLPDELFELNELEALRLDKNKDIRLSEKLIRLTNLKVLSLVECNLDTVPAVVMELQQLETLVLGNNKNITLPDEMCNLVNLTYLDLDSCDLTSVPAVVMKLSRLKGLRLSKNKNIKLPEDMSSLANLTYLKLAYCDLDTLPPVVPKLLNLQELDLSDNKQISLPEELCRLGNMKVLRLSFCNLDTVPPAVLKLTQLEELDLSRNSGIHLPDELAGLTNIRGLNLDNTDMVTVPPVVLRLTKLEWLDLSFNPLQTLPAEVGQLTNVKHLNLSYCQLHTLPTEVGRLTQLEWLNLSSTPLRALPAEVGQLTNVKHLNLYECQLRTLPRELGRLAQLQWLGLSSNPLQTLPVEVGQLTNVKRLDLYNCQLRTLPPEVGRLTQLEWLGLSSNPLQTIPAEVGQLTNIKHLDLSNCELYTLPPEVWRLTQLEWLHMSFNPVQTLPAEVGQLTNVKHLDLSYCQLHTLPTEVGRLTQLEWLNLSSTPLRALPAEVGQLTNVKHLNLYECQLRTLPRELGRLAQLQWLGLSSNPLQTLPVEVGQLTNVKRLDLNDCQLHKLPSEVGRLTQLEWLDLRSNPLQTLPAEVGQLTNVKHLDLSNCELYTLPPEVWRLTQLEWLDMSFNPVQTLPAEVGQLTNVKHLDLSNCELHKLPPEVWRLTQLEWLDLRSNPLQTLPAEVGQLINVKHLDLSNCKLHTLPPEVWILTQLEWLNLRSNPLQTIPAEVGQLTNVKHLDLSHCQLRTLPPVVWGMSQLEWLDLRDNQLQMLPAEVGQLRLSANGLEPVLSYLQQVGTILRYTDIPELKDIVFHDPPALIEIFKDLFHHSTAELFATPGIQNAYYTGEQLNNFELDLYKRGLIQKEVMTCLLPPNINPEIVTALMQRFGLCFEIQVEGETDPSKHTCWYRIPWYLQNQMPGELKSVWSEDVPETQEQLQLMCDIRGFCPRGLFQRFSVGIHPLVKDRTDWKDGAMAYRQDYPVLVCSKPVADDTYITMATRGRLAQADEMWGVVHPLLEVLVQLLQEWPGVLYSLHVTCAHCIKAGLDNPHQYDLRDRTADDGRDVRCPGVDFAASTSADLVYRPSRFSASSQHLKRSHDQAASGNRPKRSKCGKDEVAEMSGANSHQRRKRSQEQNTSGNRPKRFNGGNDKDAGALGASSKRLKRPQNQKVSANPPKKFKRGKDEVARTSGDEFVLLKWLLTEVRVKDDAFEDNYSRLASHVSELGLAFRAEVPGDGNCMFHAVSDQVLRTEGRQISHLQLREQAVDHLRRNPRNARGDHLSDFISNQSWDEYLETMSRDGTWGDHVVLQAMADMLARDVIIVSSVEADNYVTTLHPQSQVPPRAARPLLLGHYAENHYASLDGPDVPIVLLLNDEYGTSKGGISTINCQVGQTLTAAGAVVYCTALRVPKQDQEAADRDGVKLIQPVQLDEESVPTLDWLTKYHSVHYPNLPQDVTCIIGHADITDTAARNIWEQRYPQADLIMFTHVIPEDTEYYKGGRKAMKAWEKEKDMLDKADNAKAAFSVGKRIYDHFDTMYKGEKKPQNHYIFLPKPSELFLAVNVRPGGEQKVVLTAGRVRNVEKLKGHDLAAQAMGEVVKEVKNTRLRVRGISEEDWQTSLKILKDNLNSPDLNPTLLPYGTQEDIRDDMMTAHLVLMPSRSEPFGLVGLEAIAAGIPVLISDKTGLAGMINDLIDQGKLHPDRRHVIVETSVNDSNSAEDAKRWAGRIVDILNHSDSEFEKAARFKRELVESRYWEESHRTFLQACGVTAGDANL